MLGMPVETYGTEAADARIALNRTISSVREMKLPRDVLTAHSG
jgi:hypothetical protein